MKLSFVLRDKNNALRLSTKTVESFIERIKTDTKEGTVAKRRRHLNFTDDLNSYDRLNPSHLIYPSVEFERDANDNLRMRAFNGVVALTVEGLLQQADIDAVKQAAQILLYTLAAFTGPTGREVIILVRIAKAESGTKTESTAAVYTEEEADRLCKEGHRLASAIYQAVLPKAVRQEIATLRNSFRMPLDSNPYFNPDAASLPVTEKPFTASEAPEETQADGPLPEKAVAISHEAQMLIDFLNSHYHFRYNTIMGYTEYQDLSFTYAPWTPVDDRTLRGLTMKVRLNGIDARDNDVRRYVQSDMIKSYNPVSDYLWEQYNKWDGNDHIRKLARTVPTQNPLWEDWFYTWFLGMVKQWQATTFSKYGNQAVPLLISTQGWNKTTFCEMLLPPELRWGYTGNLQMDDKRQVLQQMAQMLLINLDEFNQISPRIQQGFLKNIITLSTVKMKRPYGRHVESFPRRSSFIATTNQPDVLADPSGSRRFLGVELTGPIDVTTPPNYEQLYAQAMRALYRNERSYFSSSETQQIMESNRRFTMTTATEQFFLDYFEPAADDSEGKWMSATAILRFLKGKVGVSMLRPVNASAFGRILTNIPGLRKRETKSNSEYLIKPKKK